jgi:hypothetical protein
VVLDFWFNLPIALYLNNALCKIGKIYNDARADGWMGNKIVSLKSQREP